MTTNEFIASFKGYGTVVSTRAMTGFGGIITVSAVLLAVQFITGIQAFPL
jgi:hypothetical protein